MKKYRVWKRLATALICLLIVNIVLPGISDFLWTVSASAAERERTIPEATPTDGTESREDGADEDNETDNDEDDMDQVLTMDYVLATPSKATPADTFGEIVFIDVPTLVTLEIGEAGENTWQDVLPEQANAKTDDGEQLQCNLRWSLPNVDWDAPGLYCAEIEAVLPDGYTLSNTNDSYQAFVSIHPPGMSQVMEVFTFMRYGMKGHTWTFAMKAGQDMTPLVEALESVTYRGILDDPVSDITFSAQWDFSSVIPGRPGIYPIYRSLTIEESSLPEGVDSEDIYLPDYWKDLPVLLSVESPEGPQLYGVLESPYHFFGSYAKLSEEEAALLEVWYSVDGGSWTMQTNERLMDAEEKNFYINKEAMTEEVSYSFCLKLGDFVSEVLTVKKEETSPVWFTSMMDGNRDGTIDVEFPSISQPPPEDSSGEEIKPPVTDDSGSSVDSDNSGSSGDAGGSGDAGDSGTSGNTGSPGGSGSPGGPGSPGEPGNPVRPGEPGNTSESDDSSIPASPVSGEPDSIGGKGAGEPERINQEARPQASSSPPPLTEDTKTAQGSVAVDRDTASDVKNGSGSLPVPEEVVTRWSTQISGKRCRKLIELYPDWILFQKEEVSVLLSSQWLSEQKMRDSDVLTVSVSPGEEYTVTILINQKVPRTSPIYRITVNEKEKGQSDRAARAALLALAGVGVGVALLWKRRCGS